MPFEISVFNILVIRNYKINTFSFEKGEQKKIGKNKKKLKEVKNGEDTVKGEEMRMERIKWNQKKNLKNKDNTLVN